MSTLITSDMARPRTTAKGDGAMSLRDASPVGRVTGVVKFFSRVKGYGFVTPDDGGQDVFVHYSAIDGDGYRNLYEGDRVEYTLVQTPRGPAAHNVEVKR